jgi:hypothetical protein
MIVAHIMGIPVEESVLQLAPAGVGPFLLVLFRAEIGRLARRLRRIAAQPEPATGGKR